MPLYHVYALLRGLSLGLCLPIHELFLCENGCPLLHIGLLGTAMEACKLACELPTAKITVTHGAKSSMIWAGILSTACWIGYFMARGHHLVFYYVCAFLMGAAEAFLTGSLEAWVTQQALPTRTTQELLKNSRLMIIACVVSSWGSSWFYKQSMTGCFACIISINILRVLVPLIGMRHPEVVQAGRTKSGNQISIIESVRYIRTQRDLVRIIASSFFVTMACDMVLRYYQPLLWIREIDIAYSGVVFATAAMLAWLLIGLVSRYEKKVLQRPFSVLGGLDVLGASTCVLLTKFVGNWATVASLTILLSLEDIRSPLIKSLVSQHTGDAAHTAMVLSMCATVESAAEILAGALLGYVVEDRGLYVGFLVSAVLFACSAAIGLLKRHRSKRLDRTVR